MCFPFTARQRLTNAADRPQKGNPGSGEGSGRDHLGTQCSWTENTRPSSEPPLPGFRHFLSFFPSRRIYLHHLACPLSPGPRASCDPGLRPQGSRTPLPVPPPAPQRAAGRGWKPDDFPAPPGAVDTKRAQAASLRPRPPPAPPGLVLPGPRFPASGHRALLRSWHLHPAGPPSRPSGRGPGARPPRTHLATSQPFALCCPRSEGHDMSPRKPAPRAGAGRGGAWGPAGFAPTPFSTALPVGELPAGRAAESRELR